MKVYIAYRQMGRFETMMGGEVVELDNVVNYFEGLANDDEDAMDDAIEAMGLGRCFLTGPDDEDPQELADKLKAGETVAYAWEEGDLSFVPFDSDVDKARNDAKVALLDLINSYDEDGGWA